MKSQELSEFFSLIGQAKKEKEEEFDNLLKEANVDLDSMATSLFTGIENAKVEVKEQKKKEEKLIESLDSLLVSLDKPKETTPVVVGVPEDFDISSLEEEVEEEIVQEEVVEEETVEEDDTISKAIKFIDTQLKEELKDIEPNDPTVDSIKAEVKELRNILYKVLAHGPGSGETRLENLDDVDKDTAKVDGKFIKYDSSIGKFIGADASGGDNSGITIQEEGSNVGTADSVTSINFVGDNVTASASGVGATITFSDTPQFDSLKVVGLTTFSGAATLESTNYLQLKDNTNIIGHNGVNNLFRFTDTVQFRGDTLFFQEYDGTEYLRMSEQFGVQIKHQGSTKLQIESDGITVTGTINDHTIPSGSGTFALTSDVPTNNNELTNGAGYITTSFTNTNQLTNGAGFITASDNITGTSAGLSGTPNITVGAITANSADFSGNVTIGGTLTYEDVTNIDSVGLITARNGVTINTGGLVVTSGISTVGFVTASNIYSTGIVTASSFVGDGSLLTGIGVGSTDNIITGTAATFNNVVNVGTGITLDAASGIITAKNFFGITQGQVSYITATETLTNKTLRNPTFESGANSPEFLETRYVNATQQDFVQLYTGGSSGSYFTQGEYQKVATITPSGNFQNYTFNIRLTATSASNYQIVNFTGGLRANTLPDLDFTVNFSEEHNGVRFIEPKLWTKETTTAGFILAFEYVHSSSLFGGVNVEATIIPRSSAQRANVAFNTTQDSEQSSIDTGFTERDPTLTLSTVNGIPIFGTEFKIEGSTDDGFETTITTVDATADRTITFPDSSGTVALLGDGVMSNLSDDTTPQLGGNLDLNSKDITGTGNINVSGITTISTGIGTIHIGTGSTTLLVDGDARVTGILTIGQGSITLDPNAKKISGIDEIIVGTATTVSIKQNNQGNITFEKEDGEEASVGIGTTVSINTTGIITAATLKASTAFYPPIYTTAQRDAGSFNEGAMIYNSTTKKMEFYNGTSWTSLPGMSLGLTVALDG